MPVELGDVAVLVSEHATSTIHALLSVVEGSAVLGLELLIIAASGSLSELLLSVGEAAFILIPALCCLDPVLAEFSLVLAICVALEHLVVVLMASLGLEAALSITIGILIVVGVTIEWVSLGLRRSEGLEHSRLECGSRGLET